MEKYLRDYPLVSLCGLNCGLCPMYIGKYCPGCGGGEGNQSCSIKRCAYEHDSLQFCHQCKQFPCVKYESEDVYDSFITHRNRFKDFEKMRAIGIDKYYQEQIEKNRILSYLLANYNAGRQKSFFLVAVNLLDLYELNELLIEINNQTNNTNMSLKEKSLIAVACFNECAKRKGLVLKLHRKPKNK